MGTRLQSRLIKIVQAREVASPRATTRAPRVYGLQNVSQIGPLTMRALHGELCFALRRHLVVSYPG